MIFFPAFGYQPENQCSIYQLNRQQQHYLPKVKAAELIISPKNAPKICARFTEIKEYLSFSRDLCLWRKGSRGKLHICGLAGSHDVSAYV